MASKTLVLTCDTLCPLLFPIRWLTEFGIDSSWDYAANTATSVFIMDHFYFLFILMHTEIKVQLINQELEKASRETASCNTQQSKKCHRWQRAQEELAGCHGQVSGNHVEDHHVWEEHSQSLGDSICQANSAKGTVLVLLCKANGT